MKKTRKKSILLPLSKCCLKKFYDLDLISKYGSIIIISFILLTQVYNIIIGQDVSSSFFSMIINLFFLVAILTKVEIIKVNIFRKTTQCHIKSYNFCVYFRFFWIYVINERNI